MKLRLLLVGLLAVALGVSSAVAAPPPGKGKPETAGKPASAGKPSTTGSTCKPKVTVVLKGTLASVSTGSLGVTVTHSNRWGRAYATAGSAAVTVNTDTDPGPDTMVRRNGKKLLTDLVVGDWVLVQARACKAELLAAGTPPPLTASRVIAHPAKS